MTITVIGSGNVGGSLARRWAAVGYHVRLGVRDTSDAQALALAREYPDRITLHPLAEAAAGADAIVFAVPAAAAYAAAQAVGAVGEAVVIDAMNALFAKPEPYERTSAALAAALGTRRIVKCFNWTGAENLRNPHYGTERADLLLCGDDAAAKAVARRLAEDCGFRVFDVGGLERETTLESAALVWIELSAALGRQFAFRILQR